MIQDISIDPLSQLSQISANSSILLCPSSSSSSSIQRVMRHCFTCRTVKGGLQLGDQHSLNICGGIPSVNFKKFVAALWPVCRSLLLGQKCRDCAAAGQTRLLGDFGVWEARMMGERSRPVGEGCGVCPSSCLRDGWDLMEEEGRGHSMCCQLAVFDSETDSESVSQT